MNLFGNKVTRAQSRWIGLFWVAAVISSAVLFLTKASSTRGFSVTAGTNVARVTVVVTHGTNHTFYYRGQMQWRWNEVCKRFGWRMLADGERRRSWTYEPADVLWVPCHHRGEPLEPRHFKALEVTADGRRRTYDTTGGVFDRKRGVTVNKWALRGGMKDHRGSVLHIKYGAKEIVRIEVH